MSQTGEEALSPLELEMSPLYISPEQIFEMFSPLVPPQDGNSTMEISPSLCSSLLIMSPDVTQLSPLSLVVSPPLRTFPTRNGSPSVSPLLLSSSPDQSVPLPTMMSPFDLSDSHIGGEVNADWWVVLIVLIF